MGKDAIKKIEKVQGFNGLEIYYLNMDSGPEYMLKDLYLRVEVLGEKLNEIIGSLNEGKAREDSDEMHNM